MKIWVCTTTYNNEKILPFFFQHYDFVEGFFIYDCGSTDNTINILEQQPKVVLKKTKVPFDELWLLNHRNNDWKQVNADWVFVVDPDEFIYHPDIINRLNCNYTIIMTQGYEMFADDYPSYNKPICEQIRKGVINDWYSKPVVFNAKKIKEINFKEGCHIADPVGEIRIDGQMATKRQGNNIIGQANCKSSDVKLLHYRYFGRQAFMNRWLESNIRLTKRNIQKELAIQYIMNVDQVIQLFEEAKKGVYVVL